MVRIVAPAVTSFFKVPLRVMQTGWLTLGGLGVYVTLESVKSSVDEPQDEKAAEAVEAKAMAAATAVKNFMAKDLWRRRAGWDSLRRVVVKSRLTRGEGRSFYTRFPSMWRRKKKVEGMSTPRIN